MLHTLTVQHFIYFAMRTNALSDKNSQLTKATVCQSGHCVIPTDDSPPGYNLLKHSEKQYPHKQ